LEHSRLETDQGERLSAAYQRSMQRTPNGDDFAAKVSLALPSDRNRLETRQIFLTALRPWTKDAIDTKIEILFSGHRSKFEIRFWRTLTK